MNTTTPAWVAGTAWKRFSGDSLTSVPLPQLLANYILAHHWRPARILRGTFFDRPGFLFDCVNSPVYGSDVYIWNGGSFTANDARWNGEWVRYQFDGSAFSTSVKLPSNRDTVGTTEKDIKSLRQRVAELGVVAGGIVSRWIDGWFNQSETTIGSPTGGDIYRPIVVYNTNDGFKADVQLVYNGDAEQTLTANTTLNTSARRIMVDASGGAVTITLPNATDFPFDAEIVIKKSDNGGNSVTVQGQAGQTINGAANVVTSTQYDGWTFITYNGNWLTK